MLSKKRLRELLVDMEAARYENFLIREALKRERDTLHKECNKLHLDMLKAKEDNLAMRKEIEKMIRAIFPSESFVEMFKLSWTCFPLPHEVLL